MFVGAGTSGRLGVLEAAEMPPTFGTSPDLVQGIMAGGKAAVFKAREGVEDQVRRRRQGGVSGWRRRGVTSSSGVSASGMTPFVRGGAGQRAESRRPHHLRDLRSRPANCRPSST